MTAFRKNPVSLSSCAAGLIFAATLTGITVSASAAPSSDEPTAQAPHAINKASHRKDHGKHHGPRHGMRSLLKGLDLTEAQRDRIFEIRHANMPAVREQRKQIRAARKALKAMTVERSVEPAALQAQADALSKATAAMATLRVQSMNQVMNVLTEEQANLLSEKMQERRSKHRHRGGSKS